jgi:hypothetical protein
VVAADRPLLREGTSDEGPGGEQSCDAFDAITALRRLATQSRDAEDHFVVVRLPDDPERRPEWVAEGLVTDDAVLPHRVDRAAMQRAHAAILTS